MLVHPSYEKIDYLAIGHFAKDLLPDGSHRLGGTAAYAALTAHALGLRMGIVTSMNETDLDRGIFPSDLPVCNIPSEVTTTFENSVTPEGRKQRLFAQATEISFEKIPAAWRKTPIIHLGPIAQEISAQLPVGFSTSLLGLTPQGWLRGWDADGHISPRKWSAMEASLNQAGAVVLSVEDVQGNEEIIEEMSLACRVLVITEGSEGVRLYWNGDLRRFRAPKMELLDDTGAGDIFAAAFFIRLHITRDPWEAARFATRLASHSVTRRGLESIPTQEEIQTCQLEVI